MENTNPIVTVINSLKTLREKRTEYPSADKDRFYRFLRQQVRDEGLFMEIMSLMVCDYLDFNEIVSLINLDLKKVLFGRDHLKIQIKMELDSIEGKASNFNQTTRLGYKFEIGTPICFMSSNLYSYPFRYHQAPYLKLDFFNHPLPSDKVNTTDVLSNIVYMICKFLEEREKKTGQVGFGIRSFHGINTEVMSEDFYLPFHEFIEKAEEIYSMHQITEKLG
jgi:hypothetical protein